MRIIRFPIYLLLGMLIFGSALCAVDIDDTGRQQQKLGRGITSSIARDRLGNLHVVYLSSDAKLYYGFRSAGSDRWFTLPVLESTHSIQNVYPRIAVGANGQPHICVATGQLHYITVQDGKWLQQDIDPNAGTLSYHCSIAVASDGTPHVTWYHEFLPGGKQFAHLRHAQLENGVWVVRSVDGGISGKWNSMVIDDKGLPHVSYSQFADGGALRYAVWDGQVWSIADVDSFHKASTVKIGESSGDASSAKGYDNSLALANDGSPLISYIDDTKLKLAERKEKWNIETVGYVSGSYDYYAGSTTLLLDSHGAPHIIFGDNGAIKHAFRDGDKWKIETIVAAGVQQYGNVDAVLGDDVLYVTYPDPEDGFVKLVTVPLAMTKSTGQNSSSKPTQVITDK